MTEEAKVDLDYNRPEGFDTRVEIRHPKTGRVVKHQPYTLTIAKGKFGHVHIYERDGKIKFANDLDATPEAIQGLLGPDVAFVPSIQKTSTVTTATFPKEETTGVTEAQVKTLIRDEMTKVLDAYFGKPKTETSTQTLADALDPVGSDKVA
jgi:hypothetical protein